MTFGGVFWYGVVMMVLSFAAGLAGGNVIDGMIAMAANWVLFVLPVILIRNARAKKKARRAATQGATETC